MVPVDFHTHTVAGGHGTVQTIADLAKAARLKGMTALGISDHGPATPGSCREPYFRSLSLAPKERWGVKIYYGTEANILDDTGLLDLSTDALKGLDYVIASLHSASYHPDSHKGQGKASSWDSFHQNSFRTVHPCVSSWKDLTAGGTQDYTPVYIRAMQNPAVKVLGHVDDEHFPIAPAALAEAAVRYHVILEVNEASLAPGGYRGSARPIMYNLLSECRKLGHPILLSSDSHGSAGIGEVPCCLELISQLSYPKQLILNYQPPEAFLKFRT